jgi:acyl-CoA synthetase (AMP-forming)/AMP-acid ligase II
MMPGSTLLLPATLDLTESEADQLHGLGTRIAASYGADDDPELLRDLPPADDRNRVNARAEAGSRVGLRAAFVDCGLRGDLRAELTSRNISVLDLPECAEPGAAVFTGRPLEDVGGEADDAMYVLFTSGSTGRPRGVPITNRNVVHYLDRVVSRYQLGPGARMSQTFALTFDPSVFDLFGAWTSGATLVVPRNRELLLPAVYASDRRESAPRARGALVRCA